MAARAGRIKIDRKGLRQPDEFHTLTTQVMTWAEGNRTTLFAAVGVLALCGAVSAAWSHHQSTRREAAAGAFQAAHQLFESAKFAEAASAFEDTAAANSGTPFGDLATLYRGHALARAGNQSGAIEAYEAFLTSTGDRGYLRQIALVGVAQAHEAAGQSAEALDAFSQAAALDGPLKNDALLGQARGLESTGKQDQARQIYVDLLAKNPDGELLSFLRSKIPADPSNVR